MTLHLPLTPSYFNYQNRKYFISFYSIVSMEGLNKIRALTCSNRGSNRCFGWMLSIGQVYQVQSDKNNELSRGFNH